MGKHNPFQNLEKTTEQGDPKGVSGLQSLKTKNVVSSSNDKETQFQQEKIIDSFQKNGYVIGQKDIMEVVRGASKDVLENTFRGSTSHPASSGDTSDTSDYELSQEHREMIENRCKIVETKREQQLKMCNIIEEVETIQPTDKKPSWSRISKEPSRPERVNELLKQLKNTVRGDTVGGMPINHFLLLPANLTEDFTTAFQDGVKRFQKGFEDALYHYREPDANDYKNQRQKGEELLNDSKAMLTNMIQDLQVWQKYHQALSDAQALGEEPPQLREWPEETERKYAGVLQDYKNRQAKPDRRKGFLDDARANRERFEFIHTDESLKPAWNNKDIQDLIKEINDYTPEAKEWNEKVNELWIVYDNKLKEINAEERIRTKLDQKFQMRASFIQFVHSQIRATGRTQYQDYRRRELKFPTELSLQNL